VASTFSTTIYDGTSASLTINNGIDLAGDDGLTWIKCRNAAEDHFLFSSLQNGSGQTLFLKSNTTGAAVATNGVSQTATGFTVPVDGMVNQTNNNYVSWTFKKQTKFFDVVTFTSASSGNTTFSHDLGTEPGVVVIKNTQTSDPWIIYHRSTGTTKLLAFTTSAASEQGAGTFNATSTNFTIASNLMYTSQTYVAYLFAHDTASDGLIQCGSYTGNGGSGVNSITLGWKPQWILLKNTSATGSWAMYDTVRGWVDSESDSDDARLFANSNGTESLGNAFGPTATGFEFKSGNLTWNNSGNNFVYMAIRSASAPAITWPTNIEWTAGSTPSTPAEGETDVYTFTTDDGGTTYTGIHSIDNAS
jgi:hypothetical protein